MDLNWLTNCSLYFQDERNAYLVLGTPDLPKSSVITINSTFSPPVRYPPHSQGFSNHPGISLKNAEIKEEIRITLSILLRIELEGYNYPQQIIKWIKDGSYNPAVHNFIGILYSIKPGVRQRFLYNLVKLQDENSTYLIKILFGLRNEFSEAVLREFGRWGIKADYVLKWCKEQTGNPRASLYFALNFNDQIKLFDHMEISTVIIYQLIHQKSIHGLHRMVKSDPSLLSDSILHTILHNMNTSIIFDAIENLAITVQDRKKIILPLLKFNEILRNPVLMAWILVFITSDGKNYLTPNFHKIQSLFRQKSMVYVSRRATSLIRIWKEQDFKDEINIMLRTYIQNFPSEALFTRRIRYSLFDIESWIEKHPVFANFEIELLLLLHNDPSLLRNCLGRLAKVKNHLIHGWIVRNVDMDLLLPQLVNLTMNEKLVFYVNHYVYPKGVNQFSIFRKTRGNHPLFFPTYIPDLKSVRRTVMFFYRMRYPLTDKIAEVFFQYMHSNEFHEQNSTKLWFMYLKKVKHDHHQELAIAQQLLNSILADRHQNCILCVKKISFLETWELHSLFHIPDSWQDMVDGLKLVNSELIDNLRIDAITPIASQTIITCIQQSNGSIHNILDENARFAITKYNWGQLARYYLAIGIAKPDREALKSSNLRKVPKLLLSDQLGRISLISEIFSYCMAHGFSPGLERVIINNLYLRGWNIDIKLRNQVIMVLGSVGHRLRSYLAAYLIIDQNEVTDELLLLARDVEKKIIRDRIIRALERFGSTSLWLILAGSTYQDMSDYAIDQLKRQRMVKEERLVLIQQMLNAEKGELRSTATKWMSTLEFQEGETVPMFTSVYKDTWSNIIEYFIRFRRQILEQDPNSYMVFTKMYWDPELSRKLYDQLARLSANIPQIRAHIVPLIKSGILSRAELALLSHLEVWD